MVTELQISNPIPQLLVGQVSTAGSTNQIAHGTERNCKKNVI